LLELLLFILAFNFNLFLFIGLLVIYTLSLIKFVQYNNKTNSSIKDIIYLFLFPFLMYIAYFMNYDINSLIAAYVLSSIAVLKSIVLALT